MMYDNLVCEAHSLWLCINSCQIKVFFFIIFFLRGVLLKCLEYLITFRHWSNFVLKIVSMPLCAKYNCMYLINLFLLNKLMSEFNVILIITTFIKKKNIFFGHKLVETLRTGNSVFSTGCFYSHFLHNY